MSTRASFWFALCLAAAEAQVPQAGGTILGRVVDAATSAPVPQALVSVASMGGERSVGPIESGLDGTFRFPGLPPGRYAVMAVKKGYAATSAFDLPNRPQAQWVELTSGETRGGINLRLAPYGGLVGSLVDPTSGPVRGAEVRLLRQQGADAAWRTLRTARTSERGEFEFRELPAGAFRLALIAGGDGARSWPTQFLPNTLDLGSARVVVVDAGRTAGPVLFEVGEFEAFTVEGVVVGPSGEPVEADLALEAVDAGAAGSDIPFSATRSTASGHFKFIGVAKGDYLITAAEFPRQSSGQKLRDWSRGAPKGVVLPPTPAGDTLVVRHLLSVDRVTAPVRVVATQGLPLKGRVVFDGSSQPPTGDELQRTVVAIRTAKRSARDVIPLARIESDRTFVTVGLPADEVVFGLFAGFGRWVIESVVLDGRAIAGRSFSPGPASTAVVTFADVPTQVRGSVRDSNGRPVGRSHVYLVPVDKDLRAVFEAPALTSVAAAETDRDGGFLVQVLPGEYFAFAVVEALHGEWWRSRDLDDRLRRASRVVAVRRTTLSIDLVVATGRN